MLYGHGDVEEAFQPGHVTPGQEELTQSGALRFVVGERAYAAEYDGNGNMASRATEAGAQVLTWDAENRLVGYQSSVSSASYAYDGDGVRVRTVLTDSGGVTTTVHIGGTYEWVNGSAARSYYYQGSQRVALREGGELYFLLGDHLGSTSVSYRVSDGQTVTQTYHAWGDIRPGPANALPTDYAFTGQRLQGETGLYQMGARWYDALTGRWLSADTIIPGAGNPQSLNRYSYCLNNPLAYVDPSGHWLETAWDIACIAWDIYEIKRNPSAWNIGALVLDVALAIVPFLPGGIGLLAKGGKVASHADEVVDAVRLVDAVDDATDVARAAGHVDDAADAARAAKVAQSLPVENLVGEVASQTDAAARVVPNPYGRLGGPAHQAEVARIAADIEKRGLRVRTEFHVPTPGGYKTARYVDVAALDPITKAPVEFHQVGALTARGLLVARERRAASDILNSIYRGVPLWFHMR
ncbi:MAG: RHS repeat-associated core domain-containing protein [Anaerolineae bacterium]